MKNIATSKKIQGALGVLLSVGLIVWMITTIEWSEVGRQLARVHLWALIPSVAILFVHFILRSLRWRYLLPDTERPTLRQLFDAIMVGNFATYMLPLRAGEFVRPALLSLHTNYSFSSTFVSVVIERFFDLSAVLITFGILVLRVDGLPEWAGQGAFLLSLLAGAILAFILVGTYLPEAVLKGAGIVLRALPSKAQDFANKFLKDFLEGAAILKRPRNFIFTVLLTVAVWATCYLSFYIFLWLFFDGGGSPWLAISIAVIVALAVAAPSAPGFLGVYQTACIAGFALYGISRETAAAYSIVTHALQYIIFISYGMYVLVTSELKLTDLTARPSNDGK